VNINGQIASVFASPDNIGAKSDVRDKAAIHYINMNLVCPTRLCGLHLGTEVFQVSR
jgi:hypothetical protein